MVGFQSLEFGREQFQLSHRANRSRPSLVIPGRSQAYLKGSRYRLARGGAEKLLASAQEFRSSLRWREMRLCARE